MTRRSRAIRSCSRPSWAAGTATNQARLARTIRERGAAGRRLEPVPGRPRGPFGLVPQLLRAEGRGRRRRRAAHARRARRDPRAGRRGSGKHLHAVSPGAVRAVPVGGVAGDPARDDLPARPWAVQRLRHVELVADDLRPAVDPVGEEARARAARRRAARGSCFTARPAAMRRPRRVRPGARSSPASTARSRWASVCPAPPRCGTRAVARAAAWMIARFEGSDGLSAILPAMSNAAFALTCLGHREDHPLMREALAALDGLLLDGRDGALRMQPCLSPVWDTVLAGHALAQAGVPGGRSSVWRARRRGCWRSRPTGRETGRGATPPRPAAGTSSTGTNRIPTSTTPAWR